MVSIDAAKVSNPRVVFSYRNNPNVTAVFPSNTIPSGGITLTFTGVYLDVVQRPVLEVYQLMGDLLVAIIFVLLLDARSLPCREATAVLQD